MQPNTATAIALACFSLAIACQSVLILQVGLVCFRLFGSSQLNQKLLTTINASGKLHMVPANVNEYFVIRFCVCAQNATSEDIGKVHFFSIKLLQMKTVLKILSLDDHRLLTGESIYLP